MAKICVFWTKETIDFWKMTKILSGKVFKIKDKAYGNSETIFDFEIIIFFFYKHNSYNQIDC